MVSVPTCKRKPQQIEAHLLRKVALAVQGMIRWKWAVTVAMESIFSMILRSEIPILPQCHTHLRNVFLRARFPVRGDVFVSLVNHLSPWSIDSLDQVIESTGNLTEAIAPSWRHRRISEFKIFDMNLSSRVIQVWGSLEIILGYSTMVKSSFTCVFTSRLIRLPLKYDMSGHVTFESHPRLAPRVESEIPPFQIPGED